MVQHISASHNMYRYICGKKRHILVKKRKKSDEEGILYPLWVFHPFEPGRMRWDMVLAMVMTYILISIPFKVCFEISPPRNSLWNRAEIGINAFFMADIVVNFNTAIIDDGRMITSRKTIAENYLKSWFFIDLITSIPFELLNTKDSGTRNFSVLSKTLKLARILRLLKLLRLLRLINLVSQWEERSSFGDIPMRLGKFLLVILVLTHLHACFFVGVEQYYRSNDHCWENYYGYNTDSWFVRFQETWEKQPPEQYLRALYWAFTTMTTVGYGDITPVLPMEIVVAMATQLVGASLFGFLIGNISSLISHDDETIMMIKDKLRAVKHFLSYREIPLDISLKVRQHYEYAWKRSRVYKEIEILEELPQILRMDCALHIHREIISTVPFLKSLGDTLPSLVIHLKPTLASHGDLVIKEGLIGNEMFFILNGKLAVTVFAKKIGDFEAGQHPQILIQKLCNGEYFAEYAVIMDQARHPASVTAEAYCDMYVLGRAYFLQFSDECPIAYAKLLKQGKERYLELTSEIIHKQTNHLQSCAVSYGEQEFEQMFKPGAIITFGMRLKAIQAQKAKKKARSRNLAARSQNEMLFSKTKQKPCHNNWVNEVQQRKLKYIQQVGICLQRKIKKKTDSVKSAPSSIRSLSGSDYISAAEKRRPSVVTDLAHKPNVLKYNRQGTFVIKSGSCEAEIAWWIYLKVLAWIHRAKQNLDLQNMECVEKRHRTKFNITQNRTQTKQYLNLPLENTTSLSCYNFRNSDSHPSPVHNSSRKGHNATNISELATKADVAEVKEDVRQLKCLLAQFIDQSNDAHTHVFRGQIN